MYLEWFISLEKKRPARSNRLPLLLFLSSGSRAATAGGGWCWLQWGSSFSSSSDLRQRVKRDPFLRSFLLPSLPVSSVFSSSSASSSSDAVFGVGRSANRYPLAPSPLKTRMCGHYELLEFCWLNLRLPKRKYIRRFCLVGCVSFQNQFCKVAKVTMRAR